MKKIKTENFEPSKNDKRPIARFYRCFLEDVARGISPQNCRGINPEQYRAADRLICNYERLLRSDCRGYIKVSGERCYSNMSLEARVEVMRFHAKALGQLSVKSRQILEHFCLKEQPLRKFELAQVPEWPKGAATVRLREALDDLVEVYRKMGNGV